MKTNMSGNKNDCESIPGIVDLALYDDCESTPGNVDLALYDECEIMLSKGIHTWAELKYLWARGYIDKIPGDNLDEEEFLWEQTDQPVEYEMQIVA